MAFVGLIAVGGCAQHTFQDATLSCPAEIKVGYLCKEATYKTNKGSTAALYWQECIWDHSGGDRITQNCISYLETPTERVALRRPVHDGNNKIDRSLTRQLRARPSGFGVSSREADQFLPFYELTVEQFTDLCLRYKVKFPFSGEALFCADGPGNDEVKLMVPISLQDAISIAKTELKRKGLAQSDPEGPRLSTWNFRKTGNENIEYIVVAFERPYTQTHRPSIQYNFVIDATTRGIKFYEAPFGTPVPP